MSKNNIAIPENSTSERFRVIWSKLNHNQRRFVIAMQDSLTKKEAAQAIDIEPDTTYRWPDFVDEAVVLLSENVRDTAIEILADAIAKAAMVKVGGLDSDDEGVRQKSATEIIDRFYGKAAQPHTGAGGNELMVRILGSAED